MALRVGTFDELDVGDRFESAARKLDDDLLHDLVRLGGYVHPLFTDAKFAAASPLGASPFPGEAVLLIMGGLVESTGKFDESTIALLGFEEARFAAPAIAGDEIRVVVTVEGKELTPSKSKGILVMDWDCVNHRDETIVACRARMLFSVSSAATN